MRASLFPVPHVLSRGRGGFGAPRWSTLEPMRVRASLSAYAYTPVWLTRFTLITLAFGCRSSLFAGKADLAAARPRCWRLCVCALCAAAEPPLRYMYRALNCAPALSCVAYARGKSCGILTCSNWLRRLTAFLLSSWLVWAYSRCSMRQGSERLIVRSVSLTFRRFAAAIWLRAAFHTSRITT
jgi:hypothetical protein